MGEVAGLNSHRGTGDWFQEMKSFEKLVDASRKEPDADNGRVRVAIFDTGLDLSHPDIQKARSEGRLHFHDFVEKNGTIIDQSGHGTHCASLILKYAPNAELFVGRVFRNNEADNESCGILTEVCCGCLFYSAATIEEVSSAVANVLGYPIRNVKNSLGC